MLVWQLLQGQQQQLQGEANAKDTRQENLPWSARKAKGFIFHPPPRLMGSFPNEALDLFIFSPHCTEASFNSFGHWGIAKAAAKLSSQHRSSCGKTLSLQIALCQLPWEGEEEEDVTQEVVMMGFTQPVLLHGAGLPWLPFRTFSPPSATSSVIQRSLQTLQSKRASPLITCCSFSLPPQPIWNSECREQAVAKPCSGGQEQESSIFTLWHKTLYQIECPSWGKSLTPGKVLAYLIPSERQQDLTSKKRGWINFKVV